MEISEVTGLENNEIKTKALFSFDGTTLIKTGELQNQQKLKARL